MSRELTPEAEAERAEFERETRGCSCHISPPCSHCTHPGNPQNQDEDESCWITVHEAQGEHQERRRADFKPKTIGDFPAETKWVQRQDKKGAFAVSPDDRVWLVMQGRVVEFVARPQEEAEVVG